MMKKPLQCLLIFFLLAWPMLASAHLMPEKKGTINVVGNNVYSVISVPTSALSGFDNNGDGLINPDEFSTNESSLRSQALKKFKISDGKLAATGSTAWFISPNTADEVGLPSNYLLLMHSTSYASPPKNLNIEYQLFGASASEQELTVTATHGVKKQVIIFTPGKFRNTLFRSKSDVLIDFIEIGIVHILGGYDHLLFLLTIIAAGKGLRYWVSVITSFTIAHSITLALSLWGVVSLASSIVEPLILLSIVVMAIDAYFKRDRPLWVRTGFVFACGLIHGLGFASAIGEMGIDQEHKLLSLLGFNLGIELGQALFVCVVLGLFLIGRSLYQASLKRQPA